MKINLCVGFDPEQPPLLRVVDVPALVHPVVVDGVKFRFAEWDCENQSFLLSTNVSSEKYEKLCESYSWKASTSIEATENMAPAGFEPDTLLHVKIDIVSFEPLLQKAAYAIRTISIPFAAVGGPVLYHGVRISHTWWDVNRGIAQGSGLHHKASAMGPGWDVHKIPEE